MIVRVIQKVFTQVDLSDKDQNLHASHPRLIQGKPGGRPNYSMTEFLREQLT
jgi:hypothetical protein